jgi:hypothetical protein
MADQDRLAGLHAGLREGLETPSQWRASRLLRANPLRLIKGDGQEQDPLPEFLNALREANRTRASAAQRIQEAEQLGERLWPLAETLLAQQTRDRRGLPERAAQATRLDQLAACMAELIGAYQLAVADSYGARPGKTETEQLCRGGLRVLEWTWREFELYRLRYQPVPGAIWQRTNRIFCALLAANVPDQPLKARVAPTFLTDAQGQCSRSALYLNLQAQGLFDAFSWPKTTQEFIARYCASVPQALRLEPLQTGAPAANLAHGRFIHADQDCPPSLVEPAAGQQAMVLDFTALATAIRADHQVFFRRDAGGTRAPERLRGLPSAARRPSIRLLARDMDNGAPDQHPESPGAEPEPLYLSAGMTTIRALLHQVFSRFPHSHSPGATPRTRRDPLRQPSQLRTSGDAWQLVHQSARLWRIQNPGSQSSTALSVGTLVAFGNGKAGLARPRLGRVARILRTPGVLQIDLQELACFAAPVSITAIADTLLSATSSTPQSDSQGSAARPTRTPRPPRPPRLESPPPPANADSEGERLRAFLVYDADFGWGLMTPPQQEVQEGAAIAIRTNRLHIETRLRSVRDATQDFLLFQINPHDPHLGVPSYPRAHKVRRRLGTPPPSPLKSSDSRPAVESEYRPPRF